jgi:hypothetical protein
MSFTEDDTKKAIESILSRSLLLIRNHALSDAVSAQVEAHHVHNLPHLLSDFSVKLLRYYWDIERPDYIRHAKADFAKTHEDDWKTIKEFLDEGDG